MIRKKTSQARFRILRCVKSISKKQNQYVFFIIPNIFTIVLYLICYLSSQYHQTYLNSYYMTDKEINDPNHKLLVGIMTTPNSKKFDSTINISGILDSNDSFLGGIIMSNLNSSRFPNLVDIKYPTEITDYLKTVPLAKKLWNERDLMWIKVSMQFDLGIKLIGFLQYFILNSTANWLVRYCDDAFINRFMIPDLLRYLNSRFNPIQDFYVGGACLDYIKEPILQGGSGFIISKYAAKKILSNSMDWLRDMSYYEDWEFSRLLPKMGFPVCNGTNPFFIGHSAKPFVKWLSKVGLTNLFPKCPEKLPELDFCQRVMPKMRNTAFFHDQHKVFSLFDMFNFLNYIPDNLYWYQNGESASLCLKK